MDTKKECEVCSKLIKEKYKHYTAWKVLAIVFICLTVLFAILFFANGKMFVQETEENNISISNADGNNQNNVITGSGSAINGDAESSETNTGVIIFVITIVIIGGGVVGGCIIIRKKKGDK